MLGKETRESELEIVHEAVTELWQSHDKMLIDEDWFLMNEPRIDFLR